MKKVSILNVTAGIIILVTVILNDITDEKGFALFFISIILILSGILLNKRLRDMLINFLINFF